MEFYRYEIVNYASMSDDDHIKSDIPNIALNIQVYNLHKETPMGYWIGYGGGEDELKGHSKWVSKTSKKRYAYPSKQEALNAFIIRTKRRSGILNYQLSSCRLGIGLAEQALKDLTK